MSVMMGERVLQTMVGREWSAGRSFDGVLGRDREIRYQQAVETNQLCRRDRADLGSTPLLISMVDDQRGRAIGMQSTGNPFVRSGDVYATSERSLWQALCVACLSIRMVSRSRKIN